MRGAVVGHKHGIVLIEGEPGSGKSFFATKQLLIEVINNRTPIYTNLPLVHRAVRTYLRHHGGQDVAELVEPIDREQFERFTDRAKLFQDTKEKQEHEHREMLRDWRLAGEDPQTRPKAFSRKRFAQTFEEQHGEHVMWGGDKNWLAPQALIILDEAHRWYPGHAIRSSKLQENPSLVDYLTMHRHFGHRLWVITQHENQLSMTFRRIAAYVWEVRNAGEEPIVWGIKMRHFGISAFRYKRRKPEDRDRPSWMQPPHMEHRIELPWLPKNRIIFRLYRSKTHAESASEQERRIRRAREAVGLTHDGKDTKAETKKPTRKKRTMRSQVMALGIGVFLGLMFISMNGCGSALGYGDKARELDRKLEERKQQEQEEEKQASVKKYKVQAVTPSTAFIGGKRYGLGDVLDGYTVVACVPKHGRVVLRNPDGALFVVGLRIDVPQPVEGGP